jgi:hypothetical protein
VNIPTLLVAAGIGVAFFAVEHRWFVQPDMVKPEVAFDFLSTDHMKAREAVRHRLINPASAEFGQLRTVDSDGARFVCGGVKARDKSGQLSDAAFVYAVATDFARLDDDGRMTFQQVAFKACPTSDEEKVAQQKGLISPGSLSVIKAAQKLVPKNADPSVLTTLSSMTPSGSGGGSSGGTMQQQLGELAGQPAAGGSGSGSGGGVGSGSSSSGGAGKGAGTVVEASLGNERDWRADQPPAAWPVFPAGHPLARATAKRTPAQALALARDVEERWERSKSRKDGAGRPSLDNVRDACRALLAIDPKDKDYPKAWAAFVRLRKIDREMTV